MADAAPPRLPPLVGSLARKHAEGKSKREAIRCLKRHLARRIWRLLYTTETQAAPPVLIKSLEPGNTDFHLT
jgi:hypothetical protein